MEVDWLEERNARPDVIITSQFLRLEKWPMPRSPRRVDRTTYNFKDVQMEARTTFGRNAQHMTGVRSQVQTRYDR